MKSQEITKVQQLLRYLSQTDKQTNSAINTHAASVVKSCIHSDDVLKIKVFVSLSSDIRHPPQCLLGHRRRQPRRG